MIDLIAAIDSVKFSSKSELSSRFFGRLKFSVRFEYLGLIKYAYVHARGLASRWACFLEQPLHKLGSAVAVFRLATFQSVVGP